MLPVKLLKVLPAGATMLPAELRAVLLAMVSSEREERAMAQWVLSKENR
jgi:hypothetical protein